MAEIFWAKKNMSAASAVCVLLLVSSCTDKSQIAFVDDAKDEALLTDQKSFSVSRVLKDHKLVSVDAGWEMGLNKDERYTLHGSNWTSELEQLEPLVSIWSVKSDALEKIRIGEPVVIRRMKSNE